MRPSSHANYRVSLYHVYNYLGKIKDQQIRDFVALRVPLPVCVLQGVFIVARNSPSPHPLPQKRRIILLLDGYPQAAAPILQSLQHLSRERSKPLFHHYEQCAAAPPKRGKSIRRRKMFQYKIKYAICTLALVNFNSTRQNEPNQLNPTAFLVPLFSLFAIW